MDENLFDCQIVLNTSANKFFTTVLIFFFKAFIDLSDS